MARGAASLLWLLYIIIQVADAKIASSSVGARHVQLTKGGQCTSDLVYCVKNLRPDLISGKMQSPIDINTTNSNPVSCTRMAGGINFKDYKQNLLRDFTLMNTGETAKMALKSPPTKERSLLLGGPLQGVYAFDSVHFHWGGNLSSGSEHSLNGKKYAGEIHLVHYNHMYGTYCEAKTHKDGIVILSTLLHESKKPNAEFDAIINGLHRIRTKNREILLGTPVPISALLPKSTTKYWMYRGSLTTCPFFETVVWVVFNEPLYVSRRQLRQFQSLRAGVTGASQPIYGNARDLQPLFDRAVDSVDCISNFSI